MRWCPVPGYEDIYLVSDTGIIKSVDREIYNSHNGYCKIKGRQLRPFTDKDGYQKVILCKEGHKFYAGIHRLVAMAFIPNNENKPCIDHINAITNDNRVENLRWATYKENSNNPIFIAKQTGRRHSLETRLKMSLHNNQPNCRRVKCVDTGEIFKSMSHAARYMNGSITGLKDALKANRKYKGVMFIELKKGKTDE